MYRNYGVHKPIKHIEIPCDFHDIYMGEDHINEELLIQNIPDGWLPCKANQILLTVADEHGSRGQYVNKVFRLWAKYFNCYVLELIESPLPWWDEDKSEF